MDPIDCHDELSIMAYLAILLALPPPIVVLSLVHGFSLILTLVFVEDRTDGVLARGMACHEVEQLLRHPWFVVSMLMNKCFVGHAEDERPNHVHMHDVGKVIALLGKTTDVLT